MAGIVRESPAISSGRGVIARGRSISFATKDAGVCSPCVGPFSPARFDDVLDAHHAGCQPERREDGHGAVWRGANFNGYVLTVRIGSTKPARLPAECRPLKTRN
jgi:hypothetical protein